MRKILDIEWPQQVVKLLEYRFIKSYSGEETFAICEFCDRDYHYAKDNLNLLISSLATKDESEKVRIINRLATIYDDNTVLEHLYELLCEQNLPLRISAIKALHAITKIVKNLEKIGYILECLNDNDELVRCTAISILEILGDASTANAILRIISNDPSSTARAAAVRCLASFSSLNDEKIISWLKQALTNENSEYVKSVISKTIEELTKDVKH